MVDATLGYVDITCSDRDLLRQWTKQQWYRNIDAVLDARQRWIRKEITKTQLNELITSAGFWPTEAGLLADMELRLPCNFLEVWKYDWMHTAFQDGFMSNAMWMVCSRVSSIKYGNDRCESILAHLKGCQFPLSRSSVGRQLHRLFGEPMLKKHRRHQGLVANASTQFTLYPILKDWALLEAERAEGMPALLPHVAVYVAACHVIDIIKLVKHRLLSTTTAKLRLLIALGRWQDLHKVQYGTRFIKPKTFWMWSIAFGIADSEWLFDMFYIERQHKRVRPQAELVKNTKRFEFSVLTRVLDAQICSMQGADIVQENYRLLGKQVRNQHGGIAGLMADKCVSAGALMSCDDIVVNDRAFAAVILACVLCDDGRLLLKVEMLQQIMGTSAWTQTPLQELWLARDARQPTAWRRRGDGSIVVLD